jgi:hypothetical protein
MSQPDIRYAVGAIHDEYGPITSFAAETDAGRKWLIGWAGEQDGYLIEADTADQVIGCMEADGLCVVRA